MHVLSGQWPFPGEAVRVNPRNPNDPNDLVGVTEFDRREEYISKIDNRHPLMHLIQLCLSNSPSHRPTSYEVQQQVSAVSAEHPASFANRVEMLERIKALGEEKEAVRMEKNNAVTEKDEQIAELRREKDAAVREKEQVSAELEETQSSMKRLQQSHSVELERMQLKVSENLYLQTIVNTKEGEIKVLKQIKQHLVEQHILQLAALENEHISVKRAMEKRHQTQLELKASELSSKDALISSNSETIQSLQGELRALETSSSSKDSLNVFSPGMKMNFTNCAKMPLHDGVGQAICVGKEVYVGFVESKNVLKYNITKDSWSILPEAPVKYSSIGYLWQKIMLIGGQLRLNRRVTGNIHEFDEATQKWVRSTSIPPMPIARKSATAVSWTSPSALIVCGGSDENQKTMTVVDVFHSRTSQWHTVSHLPLPRDYMSHSIIHDVVYLIGGYETSAIGSYTKTVMSASIPQLLASCLQPSRTPPVQWQSGSIPDVLHYWSTAASLGGCLLVIGGSTEPRVYVGESLSSVHAYCPSSSSWVCVGELPQPLAECITVTLPTGELLVLGGRSSKWSKTTYKCCLSVHVY